MAGRLASFRSRLLLGLLLFLAAGVFAGVAIACPFCAVESQTLTEEIQGSDVAVIARLVKEAPTVDPPSEEFGEGGVTTGNAIFEVVEILRGEEKLGETRTIEVVYFGEPNRDQLFLIPGISAETLDWTTPLPLSEAAVGYVRKLEELPATGADRLAFFQEFFEHADPLLAQDAYDEFARAPYADVTDLGPRMPHDKLIEWIQDPEVSPSRRRLYFTMLGVCGNEGDLPLLEEMITSDYDSKAPFVESLVHTGLAMGGPTALPTWIEMINQDERRKKLGLDALVACYLVLRGADGLDLVDAELLKNPKAEYTHVYSTIMALRFHGDETSVIPRERLLESMRLLLDNPDFADQVIIDLSRWEDWSVMDRLVSMFKTSDEKGYVRQPIVTYLTVASEQEGELGQKAAGALTELEEFDPESVKRAKSLMAFGFLGRARAQGDGSNAARPEGSAELTADSEGDAGEEDGGEVAQAEGSVTGFEATPEELEEADAAVDEIPDPALYGQTGAEELEATEGTVRVAAVADEAEPEQGDGEAGRGEPGDGENAAVESGVADATATAPSASTGTGDSTGTTEASSAASPSAVAEASSVAAAEQEANLLLIVGLPLVATAILMGLYWWILRSGAV